MAGDHTPVYVRDSDVEAVEAQGSVDIESVEQFADVVGKVSHWVDGIEDGDHGAALTHIVQEYYRLKEPYMGDESVPTADSDGDPFADQRTDTGGVDLRIQTKQGDDTDDSVTTNVGDDGSDRTRTGGIDLREETQTDD